MLCCLLTNMIGNLKIIYLKQGITGKFSANVCTLLVYLGVTDTPLRDIRRCGSKYDMA